MKETDHRVGTSKRC